MNKIKWYSNPPLKLNFSVASLSSNRKTLTKQLKLLLIIMIIIVNVTRKQSSVSLLPGHRNKVQSIPLILSISRATFRTFFQTLFARLIYILMCFLIKPLGLLSHSLNTVQEKTWTLMKNRKILKRIGKNWENKQRNSINPLFIYKDFFQSAVSFVFYLRFISNNSL